jgi:hypothetical protein
LAEVSASMPAIPARKPTIHGTDNEDRLIKHGSDAGDHGRDDHETELGDGEPGFLACALFRLFPDHCIRRLARA